MIRHGTLNLAICGRSRVVVCSDSRGAASPVDGIPADDNCQKLFQCGTSTACASSGILIGPGLYIPDRLAAICADAKLQDRPRATLARIESELRGPIDAALLEDAKHPVDRCSDDFVFDVFCIRRQDSGAIDLVALHFPMTTDSDGNPALGTAEVSLPLIDSLPSWAPRDIVRGDGILLPPGAIVPYSFGHGECLTKELEQKLDVNVLSDEAILSGIDQIFETARQARPICAAEIGGPIDVAAIDAAGFRWLRKKPAIAAVVAPAPSLASALAASPLQFIFYEAAAYAHWITSGCRLLFRRLARARIRLSTVLSDCARWWRNR
jgi:hypothetical protein